MRCVLFFHSDNCAVLAILNIINWMLRMRRIYRRYVSRNVALMEKYTEQSIEESRCSVEWFAHLKRTNKTLKVDRLIANTLSRKIHTLYITHNTTYDFISKYKTGKFNVTISYQASVKLLRRMSASHSIGSTFNILICHRRMSVRRCSCTCMM